MSVERPPIQLQPIITVYVEKKVDLNNYYRVKDFLETTGTIDVLFIRISMHIHRKQLTFRNLIFWFDIVTTQDHLMIPHCL